MLLNLSQDLARKNKIISEQIGKPFPLEVREKLGGTMLKELPITAASIEIYNLLVLNQVQSFCSIEMRPKGVLLSFRSKKDIYSLVVPFYKLRVYKGRAEEYSFYRDQHFIKIWAGSTQTEIHSFVKKIKNYKADNAFPRIEDLL